MFFIDSFGWKGIRLFSDRFFDGEGAWLRAVGGNGRVRVAAANGNWLVFKMGGFARCGILGRRLESLLRGAYHR